MTHCSVQAASQWHTVVACMAFLLLGLDRQPCGSVPVWSSRTPGGYLRAYKLTLLTHMAPHCIAPHLSHTHRPLLVPRLMSGLSCCHAVRSGQHQPLSRT